MNDWHNFFQINNSIPNQFWPRPIRQWSQTSFGRNFRYNHRRGQCFVLMSYNILAQSLLLKHPHLYRNHDPRFLDWNYRLRCIQNEIFHVKPAILCLQEVQDVYIPDIEQALRPLNYAKPLYKQRTGNGYDDGCAIFYDSQLFELLDHQYVEFYQPNVKVLNRNNVAIIAKFASKRLKNQQFVVATTHLLFNPRRDDVRIAQLQVLLAELDRMSVHTNTQDPLPIILTGDFNSLQSSAPYRLVDGGHIDSMNLPLRLGIMDDCQHMNVTVHKNRKDTALFNTGDREGGPEREDSADADNSAMNDIKHFGVPYNTGALWHYLNFSSTLYADEIASTYQDKWIMVDYIFYTRFTRRTLGPLVETPKFSSLQLISNYQLPCIQDCQMIGLIPNAIYGSDHYSMASEFVLLVRFNKGKCYLYKEKNGFYNKYLSKYGIYCQ